MRILPNIKISRDEINRLIRQRISLGGESYICLSPEQKTIYKLFIDPELSAGLMFTAEDLVSLPDNKFNKIVSLHQLKPKHCTLPLSTISMEGRLVGYEMTFDSSDTTLSFESLFPEEKLYYLKKTKKILEYFASKDITYGDVAERNVLINRETGQVKFCDMDNIRLKQYPIDLLSSELEEYSIERGIDDSADAYMHNIMTILGLEIDMCRCFESGKYLRSYFRKNAYSVLDSMGEPKEFNGEYLIQYVKKRGFQNESNAKH